MELLALPACMGKCCGGYTAGGSGVDRSMAVTPLPGPAPLYGVELLLEDMTVKGRDQVPVYG